jgi:hypothetical protein
MTDQKLHVECPQGAPMCDACLAKMKLVDDLLDRVVEATEHDDIRLFALLEAFAGVTAMTHLTDKELEFLFAWIRHVRRRGRMTATTRPPGPPG